MTHRSVVQIAWFLAALLTVAVILNVWQLWEQAVLKIRVSFADDQVQIFEEFRKRAIDAGLVGGAEYLEAVKTYYPSGTKQETGSKLDRIVERARQGAMREIIGHLRTQAEKDLGDNPDDWIRAYASSDRMPQSSPVP